jgi:uncharacterized protein YecE (DUF72 family)
VRIGISGWRYAHWRGTFYPPKLPQRAELKFNASVFSSVEINGTFYSLQRPSSFKAWAAATPASFVFSVKGPRLITHMYKLRHSEEALANFFASGLLELGPKLGPILWQFPPQMRFDPERFATFFDQLPRTYEECAQMARLHGPRLNGRATLHLTPDAAPKTRLRHCVEIRDQSFACPEFIALLRRHDIGLVVADTVGWPLLFDLTSDFVYCRLHGSQELYASGYDDLALNLWADRVVGWSQGLSREDHRASPAKAKDKPRYVYVYFDNDAKVRAPFDAQALAAKVMERLKS